MTRERRTQAAIKHLLSQGYVITLPAKTHQAGQATTPTSNRAGNATSTAAAEAAAPIATEEKGVKA